MGYLCACGCKGRVNHKGSFRKRCAESRGVACDTSGKTKKRNAKNLKKRKASGALKESNDKSNKKRKASGAAKESNDYHNPVNAAKKKVALRLTAEDFHRNNGDDVQTEHERDYIIDAFMNAKLPELGGKSWDMTILGKCYFFGHR